MRTALRRHFPEGRLEFLIGVLQRRAPWLVRNRERVRGICLKWGGVAVQSRIFRDGAIRRAMVPLPYGDFSHQSSVPHGVKGKEMVWGEICQRSSLEMLFSPCLVLWDGAQTQVLLRVLPCVTLSIPLGHSSAGQIQRVTPQRV